MADQANGSGSDNLDELSNLFGPLEHEQDPVVFFRHSPVNRYWKSSAAEELPTEHGARYVSGLTIYDEIFAKGRLIGRYRSAHGPNAFEDELDGFISRFVGERPLEAFELVIDGQSLDSHWRWAESRQDRDEEGRVHAVIKLEHGVRAVRVGVHTLLDGTPYMKRWLEITNTGDEIAALGRVSPWSGLLSDVKSLGRTTQELRELVSPGLEDLFALGRFRHTTWGHEGAFAWEGLRPGERVISTPHGSSGWGLPFFVVKNELKGDFYVGHLAWSGNWEIGFYNDYYDNPVPRMARLFFRAGPKAPAPQRLIETGETIVTPALHLGHVHDTLDVAVQGLHAHIRGTVMPRCLEHLEVGHWRAVKNVVQQKQLGDATPDHYIRGQVDAYAEIGAKFYQLCEWHGNPKDQDYVKSFTRGRGDWFEPVRFSTGLREFGDYLRSRGTRLQIWMEPEVADDGTLVAVEHPDWFLMRDGDPLANQASRTGGTPRTALLDVSRPEVAQWIEAQVSRVIEDYGPDEIYWDYNSRPGIGGQRQVGDYVENTTWRYYENLYRLRQSLASRYPHVSWVNCAGGGARNDLGVLEGGAHCTQVTDYSVMPRSIKMINGLSMALPPEAIFFITSHVAESTLWGDYRTQMRVSLFCGVSMLGLHPVKETGMKAMWEVTAHYVRLYNDFIADTMRNCSVYHHTPVLPMDEPCEWCVLEYVSKSADTGYAGIFRLAAAESDDYVFRARGLDPNAQYEVTIENTGAIVVRSGQELREEGIRVRLSVPMTSELLLFRRAV